jgi:tetratricopeptide (TPR) repeat protein
MKQPDRRRFLLLSAGALGAAALGGAAWQNSCAELPVVRRTIKSGNQLHYVYLYAGETCRIAGRYKEAIAYYEKVASVPTDNNGHINRSHERAKANIEAIKLFELSDVKQAIVARHYL